jgi:hypothetical protein
MAIKHIIVLFVETPRKFIISIYYSFKLLSQVVQSYLSAPNPTPYLTMLFPGLFLIGEYHVLLNQSPPPSMHKEYNTSINAWIELYELFFISCGRSDRLNPSKNLHPLGLDYSHHVRVRYIRVLTMF